MATRPYVLPDGQVVHLPAEMPQEEAFAHIREQFGLTAPQERSQDRGVLSQIVDSMQAGTYGLGKQATEGLLSLLPDSMEEPYVTASRNWFDERIRQNLPPEDQRGGLVDVVSQAAGSYGPYLGLLPLGPFALPAGVGLGMLAGAGDARLRAAEAGEEQTAGRTALGAGIGATQFFAPARILSRIRQPVARTVREMEKAILDRWGPEASKMYRARAADALKAGTDEAVSETIYGIGQNMLEQGYNPERETLDGVGQDAAMGGGLGGFAQTVLGRRAALALNRAARDRAAIEAREANTTPATGQAAPQDTPPQGTVTPPPGVRIDGAISESAREAEDALLASVTEGDTPTPAVTAPEAGSYRELHAELLRLRADHARAKADNRPETAATLTAEGEALAEQVRAAAQTEAGLPPTATATDWVRYYADNPDAIPPVRQGGVDFAALGAKVQEADAKIEALWADARKATKVETNEELPQATRTALNRRTNSIRGHLTNSMQTAVPFLRRAGVYDPVARTRAVEDAKAARKAQREAERVQREVERTGTEPVAAGAVTTTVDAPGSTREMRLPPDPIVVQEARAADVDPTMPLDTDDSPDTGVRAEAMVTVGERLAQARAALEAADAGTNTDARIAARTQAQEVLSQSNQLLADLGMDPTALPVSTLEAIRAIRSRTAPVEGDVVNAGSAVQGTGTDGADTAGTGVSPRISGRRRPLPAAVPDAPFTAPVGRPDAVSGQSQSGEGTGADSLTPAAPATPAPRTLPELIRALPEEIQGGPLQNKLASLERNWRGRDRAVWRGLLNNGDTGVKRELDALRETNPAAARRVQKMIEAGTRAATAAPPRAEPTPVETARAADARTAQENSRIAAFVNDTLAAHTTVTPQVEIITPETHVELERLRRERDAAKKPKEIAALDERIAAIEETGEIIPERQDLVRMGDSVGTRVIFVRPTAGSRAPFNGFTLRGYDTTALRNSAQDVHRLVGTFDDVIFINEGTSKPLMTVFGHEFLHTARERYPDTYNKLKEQVETYLAPHKHDDAFKKVAMRVLGEHNISKKKFLELMASEATPETETTNRSLQLEEVLGDIVGERMGDADFWNGLLDIDNAGTRLWPEQREGANQVVHPLVDIARRMMGAMKGVFLDKGATTKTSAQLRQLDGAIRQMLEVSALGTEPTRSVSDPTTKAQIQTVLFSRIADPAMRDDIGRLAKLGGILAPLPSDPGPSLARDAIAQVRQHGPRRSFSDFFTKLRLLATDHLAFNEREYGGQQTWRKDVDDVNSYINGHGAAVQALAAGEFTHNAMANGHLEIDKYGNFHVVSGDSLLSIHRDLGTLAAKYGTDPASMSSMLSLYAYGSRVRGVRRTYDFLTSEINRAEAAGLSRSANMLRHEADRLEAFLGRYDQDGILEAAAEVGQKFPEMAELTSRMREQTLHVVDLLEASGRISKEKAASFRQTEGYIPMFTEQTGSDKFSEMLSADVRRITGGNRHNLGNIGMLPELTAATEAGPVADVFSNMERFLHWGHAQALDTFAGAQLIREADVWNLGQPLERSEHAEAFDPAVTVSAYENGQRYFYKVADPMATAAFRGMKTSSAGPILRGAANVLRKSVTLAPGFSVGQLPQDAMRAMLMSGVAHPVRTMRRVFTSFTREMARTATGAPRSAAVQDLAAHGITPEVDYPELGMSRLSDYASASRWGPLSKMYRGLDRMSKASDLAQREAVYKSTMDETGDRTLALVRAREVINFRRGGASQSVTTLRTVVPFLNAYMQGMEVLRRAMTGTQNQVNFQLGRPQSRRENLSRFWGNGMMVGALMALYAAANTGDDEYEGMAEWARDRFFLIPGTSGVFNEAPIRIPVPLEVGFLFKVIPERLIRHMMQEGRAEGETTRELISALAQSAGRGYASPNLIPLAAKLPVELATNFSSFTGQAIEGLGLQNLPKSQRFSTSTSELARALSPWISSDSANAGPSPVQIDHTIRGLFGMLGGAVLVLSDAVMGNKPELAAQDIARGLTFGSFVGPDTRQGLTEQYYELRAEADRANGAVSRAYFMSGTAAAQQEQEKVRGHIANRPMFNQLDKVIADVRRQKQLVERNIREGRMTREEGRERVRELDRLIESRLENILPQAMRNVRDARQ